MSEEYFKNSRKIEGDASTYNNQILALQTILDKKGHRFDRMGYQIANPILDMGLVETSHAKFFYHLPDNNLAVSIEVVKTELTSPELNITAGGKNEKQVNEFLDEIVEQVSVSESKV